MSFKILVAEDEKITLNNMVETLHEQGYRVTGVTGGLDALAKTEKEQFDVLITDIKLPGLDGIALLEKIKEKYPDIAVLVITAYGSINSAVDAIKKGAYEYLTKPFDLEELILKVKKIESEKVLRRENIALKTYINIRKDLTIIAQSMGMKNILATIENIKDSDANVLLTGETGVGKSLVAKIIHYTSRRKEHPFLILNCATFTEELLASELFGYEKGAFTGAVSKKPGLAEIADTGTLFLDEIAEISRSLQAKLLRLIEEKEFFRVGGTRTQKVDVRFIAATNRNVQELINEAKFRKDLYYRLNIVEIFIPALRDRKEDIKPLCHYFLKKHLPKTSKKISGFSDTTMAILMDYHFPGNVRELENIIERAIIVESTSTITPQSLPHGLYPLATATLELEKIKTLTELNREYALKIVKMLGGNRSKAAQLLGISRTSLWKILKNPKC